MTTTETLSKRYPIPVVRTTEVLVVGGGPAGVIAAIAAARNGAHTLLLERYGFLGGNATNSLVGAILGLHNGHKKAVGGIPDELFERMIQYGGAQWVSWRDNIGGEQRPPESILVENPKEFIAFDPEILKLTALEMCEEAGVELLFHAFAFDVNTSGDEARHIIFLSKSGLQAIEAQIVIDCSGDADIAAAAGCPWEKGDEHGNLQPMTLEFRLGGVDLQRMDRSQLRKILIAGFEQGQIPLFGGPWIGKKSTIRSGEVTVNMIRIHGDATDVWNISECEITARHQVQEFIRFMQENAPGFENCYLIDTAPQIGVRETRRIQGLYQLTGQDLVHLKRFDDVVALGAHPVDIHSPHTPDIRFIWFKHGVTYDIPYRSLVPVKVNNLLVAGRCFSSDREANGSGRVMGTCMAMGQAAGTAAALCVQHRIRPAEVNVKELQAQLLKDNAILDSTPLRPDGSPFPEDEPLIIEGGG